ncbi:MAG: HD domain-containing phosphohydrolase [Gemmataceae bacterium]
MQTRIILSGSSPTIEGLSWESDSFIRIGRLESNDIVLSDVSVGQIQAEIRRKEGGWVLRDLGNVRNPSYVNGTPVPGREIELRLTDVLQFGRLALTVTVLETEPSSAKGRLPDHTPSPFERKPLEQLARAVSAKKAVATPNSSELPPEPANKPKAPHETSNDSNPPPTTRQDDPHDHLKTSGTFVRIQARTHRTYDQALEAIVSGPMGNLHQSQHLLTLLRAGYHLCQISSLEELLQSILSDTIKALDAQRGAIVLATPHGELHLGAKLSPKIPNDPSLGFSQTLAQRCFGEGQSLLCQDVALESVIRTAGSVRRGAMASIICAVLRSPRKRLGVLHLDRGPLQAPFSSHDFYFADAVAASVSVGIESAMILEEQREEFIQAVTSLARTVELRDQYTGDHTLRVTKYAMLLARELRLSPSEIYNIEIGTPLHDIGKIGLDDAILRKRGRLTKTEFDIMKTHTVRGAEILNAMRNLGPMITIIRHHHEKWDGSGYPDGLAGENIPRIARVVSVADAFDAMTSDRPYRKALPPSVAFQELQNHAGTHFDPTCVEAFLKVHAQVQEMMQN